MPFGLRNATQTFQKFMDNIFKNLQYVSVCIDDILIVSKDQEEHKGHLENVMKRLQENNLRTISHKNL